MSNKVLVIDNNLDIIQLLKEQLPAKGFEVRFASSGEEGLSAAKDFKPDVILLDILNPEVSGFEILKKLKSDSETACIPVILDSIVENYKEKALQLGAVDYLSKPINMEKLYSSVEKAVGGGKAVVVIDDEPAIVEMTKDFLESRGIKTYCALTGSNGIALLQKEKIGAIILDLKMPGMDGYEVIKIIKDNPITCDIPIVVVTSVDIDECKEKCMMLGADECMRKPFNGEMLIEQVNNLINRTIRKEKQYMDFSKGRILIADDEESILSMVSDILEMQGYDLILAHNGQEALDKIYSENPDLVILDVNMPHKNGYEVCSKIREDILMANLPIIMLTARTTEKDEIRGLELGVDDYLTKPVRPSVLTARVRAALSRIQQGVNVNPLTYLPGNTSIAREIERRLKNEEIFAVLYVDLDRFKAYNDFYGFHKGDEIIKATARILVDTVRHWNPEIGFIGHIGGDDFICIVSDENVNGVCEDIIEKFDKTIRDYYNIEDKERGYITIENRNGQLEKFGFVALSIGVVSTSNKQFSHIGQISKLGAELKKFAKKDEQSNYVFDRRSL